MEAKDTVMEKNQLKDIILKIYCSPETTRRDITISDWCYDMVEAQAEISFKAGYDSRKEEIEELMSIAFTDGEKAGRQDGIREVVEWIENEDAIDRMCRERWQDFLKSKGINEKI